MTSVNILLALLVTMISPLSVWASVQSVEEKYQELVSDPERLKSIVSDNIEAEELPLEALTYKDLYRDISIQQKWNILADLATKSPEFAKGIYLSCIESTDWLLRVGGLKFLATMDAQLAIEKAQKLLEADNALLVRSAAMDVLLELGGIARVKDTLWTALTDKKNFHRGNSLWIRQNIANALLAFTDMTDNPQWANFLEDKDVIVQTAAINALEKNHQTRLGSQTDSLDVRSALWKTKLAESTRINPIATPGSLHSELPKKPTSIHSHKIEPQMPSDSIDEPSSM